MVRTVRPFVSWPIAFWIRTSLSASAQAVASSRMTMGESFSMARARAMRCLSPPDSWPPASVILVSSPSGSLSMMSSHWARERALMTSSRLAFLRASATFS